MTNYAYTTRRQLRVAFWQLFPHLSKQKILDPAWHRKTYTRETLSAWRDWVGTLEKSATISADLADRATLR